MRHPTTPTLLAVLSLACASLGAGCGKESEPRSIDRPVLGLPGSEKESARALGFPSFATKNTTRVGGADAVADAAGVARAVFPSTSPATRPDAVTLVDQDDWRAALAASVFMSRPVRAPVLLTDGDKLPSASADALKALQPTGSPDAGGAQVIRIGDVVRPEGFKTTDVAGKDPFELAAAIDRLSTAAQGSPSDAVVVVSADAPEFAMPAAGWAARSGDSLLYVKRDEVPPATMAALRRHQQPRIYVLGPRSTVGGRAIGVLRRLGSVERIEGADPTRNAVAFAQFTDGQFGWGVVDPGHGLVFANPRQTTAAAAAAPLSASGKYGPLLLTDAKGGLPPTLVQFLLDIQPGYKLDPVRALYNHGWLIGDERAVTGATQTRIDALLEVTQQKVDKDR